MKFAPIVLFVYNRLDHTKKTVEALTKNKYASDSELFVFSDAPKNSDSKQDVQQVRQYIDTIEGFKKLKVITRDENFGLAKSIISGVTEVLKEYPCVIVLEDDIVTSPYFLKYMNEALEIYQNEKKVGSISGFAFSKETMRIPEQYKSDIYFSLRPSSWGWATWRDRWSSIDWNMRDFNSFKWNLLERYRFNLGGSDLSSMLIAQKKGKIDSWAIRWAYNFFRKGWLSVYPVISFVNNIGSDNSGVHSKTSNKKLYENRGLNMNPNVKFPSKIELNKEILNSFRKVYSKSFSYYWRKILFKLRIE